MPPEPVTVLDLAKIIEDHVFDDLGVAVVDSEAAAHAITDYLRSHGVALCPS